MKTILFLNTLFFVIALTNCNINRDDGNTRYKAEFEKIESKTHPNFRHKLNYKADSLEGGLAVMGYSGDEPLSAFWIKDDVIYAANKIARTSCDKKIEFAPEGIDFNAVLSAVEE